jgi:hypothetical protein
VRLLDLAVVYLVVGLGCAWALHARRRGEGRTSLADSLLTFSLWPLYVPMLLTAPDDAARRAPSRATTARVVRECELLTEALTATRRRLVHPSLAPLLPTDAQLRRLTEHVACLDARVHELDQVLAGEEFDPARAERMLRSDRGSAEAAAAAMEGARRLQAMRARAPRARDELLGLCARLRMQVTVLRFAEAPQGEALGELLSELMGRIEGVGEALDPAAAQVR